MKELIGKKILEIYIDKEDQSHLKFTTDIGDVCYETEGDCCSETWFADIISVENLLGGTVIKVEEVEMGECPNDGRTRQEYDEVYGFKVYTEMGIADIIFRNSSNGYYGGWIYYKQDLGAGIKWQKVTEDYKA